MNTKVCTKCNTEKPITEYYTIKNKWGVYTYNYCKHCHYHKMTKHTAAEWRVNNPERWQKDVTNALRAHRGRMSKGVYLIVTNKGLYVGKSSCIELRINQHKISNRRGCIGYYGAKYLFHIILQHEENAYKRTKLEKYWIQKLKPSLNKQHHPDWQKVYNGGYKRKK